MKNRSVNLSHRHQLRRYLTVAAVAWSVVIAGLAVVYVLHHRADTVEIARVLARDTYEKDSLYRRWISSHGGVYVRSSGGGEAGAAWYAPELTTASGEVLTRISPEEMTRQVYADVRPASGVFARVTSARPVNPVNAPDDWEAQALAALELGRREVTGLFEADGEPRMRLLRPIFVEQSCLACHRSQGYEVGDVRGGLSVSVPMKSLRQVATRDERRSALGFAFLWGLGVLGIVAGGRRLGTQFAERERAEAALQRSQRFLQTIIDSIPEMTMVIDRDHRVALANRAARDEFGEPDLDTSGMRCFEVSHRRDRPCDSAETPCPMAQVLATGLPATVTHTHFDGEGNEQVVEVTVSPILDSDGAVVRVVETCRDVTARVEAERALRKKAEQLRQAQKLEALGGLAGGVAHEFNNLLQAIDGYTRYAMEGLAAEDQRHQDLEQVLKAAERASTITRGLLSFSRRQTMEREHVDPNQLVADVGKMLRPLIGEHIELRLQPQPGVGTVHADPSELLQILLNLCVNARDAMPGGGTLTVKTKALTVGEELGDAYLDLAAGRYVCFVVADTGEGIPPDVRERIFEPFFTTKEVGKGTGLGLATVYGIVKQHQGTVHVYSEPGRGTTFRVYLPVVCTPDEDEPVAPAACDCRGTETILVAEDDPMVRDLAVRILEGAGYTVLAAPDGEAALRLFEENRDAVSLVILDAVMPKLTGHEVWRRIGCDRPEMKAVFCTGYDPDADGRGLATAGGLSVLSKPFDPDDLLSTVRTALDAEPPAVLAAGPAEGGPF